MQYDAHVTTYLTEQVYWLSRDLPTKPEFFISNKVALDAAVTTLLCDLDEAEQHGIVIHEPIILTVKYQVDRVTREAHFVDAAADYVMAPSQPLRNLVGLYAVTLPKEKE